MAHTYPVLNQWESGQLEWLEKEVRQLKEIQRDLKSRADKVIPWFIAFLGFFSSVFVASLFKFIHSQNPAVTNITLLLLTCSICMLWLCIVYWAVACFQLFLLRRPMMDATNRSLVVRGLIDHLAILLAPKIAEENEFFAEQAAIQAAPEQAAPQDPEDVEAGQQAAPQDVQEDIQAARQELGPLGMRMSSLQRFATIPNRFRCFVGLLFLVMGTSFLPLAAVPML